MQFNWTEHKDKLFFVPLGGASEIGMNLNLYHYNGKWLMIDLGMGFAGEEFPGADLIVPDITFLKKHIKENLIGIVLTHAHEDHIGAIQYLWEELNNPTLYATKFTAAVLKNKLAEVGILPEVTLKKLPINDTLKLPPFELETVGITHSIPEMQGISIKTPHGTVFHTGDWKLDHNPKVGDASNETALKRIGEEGVLALVGDSTNIFHEKESGSEGDLQQSLEKLIKSHQKGLVVVTTFASNIARLASLIQAAENTGREVALLGTSLWRLHAAAKECGYLSNTPIDGRDLKKYDKKKLLVIATGCQGEGRAAMSKLADNKHPNIRLAPDDLVIFSSKIIPGNEKKIAKLLNKLSRNNIKVFTEKDQFVHVSGHPSKVEVGRMYDLVKPKFAVPIHGEAVHIQEHAEFALTRGVEQSIKPTNGDIICIDQDQVKIMGQVHSGYLAVDGRFLIEEHSPILKMRSKMRDNGIIVATIVVNNKNQILKHPKIIAPGIFDEREDRMLINSLVELIYESTNALQVKGKTSHNLERTIKSIIKNFVRDETSKKPIIFIQIEKISKA